MNETFRQHVESLHPAFERLVAAKPFKYIEAAAQALPVRGIYLFTESESHLYVGRSDNILQRLHFHCRESSDHNKASFAFRLAREVCGATKPAYKKEGSRADLMSQEAFLAAFFAQKARVRGMDIRAVQEDDANRQALLEMYASITLGTPYNDFNNH